MHSCEFRFLLPVIRFRIFDRTWHSRGVQKNKTRPSRSSSIILSRRFGRRQWLSIDQPSITLKLLRLEECFPTHVCRRLRCSDSLSLSIKLRTPRAQMRITFASGRIERVSSSWANAKQKRSALPLLHISHCVIHCHIENRYGCYTSRRHSAGYDSTDSNQLDRVLT